MRLELLVTFLLCQVISLLAWAGWQSQPRRPRHDTKLFWSEHDRHDSIHHHMMTRSTFWQSLTISAVSAGTLFIPLSTAFEGGVGGLGKTKPETGVEFFNFDTFVFGRSEEAKPIAQNVKTGLVSAELSVNGQPVLVSFYSPSSWPLSATAAGLEARDLAQPESTYVHIVTSSTNAAVANLPIVTSKNEETGVTTESLSRSTMKDILLDSVLSQKGKFGAYGAPTDVKVKKYQDAAPRSSTTTSQDLGIYQVSFTTLTPGMRESERVLLISTRRILVSKEQTQKSTPTQPSALALLVTGTTRQRFASQQGLLEKVAQSWEVVPAPATRLLREKNIPMVDNNDTAESYKL